MLLINWKLSQGKVVRRTTLARVEMRLTQTGLPTWTPVRTENDQKGRIWQRNKIHGVEYIRTYVLTNRGGGMNGRGDDRLVTVISPRPESSVSFSEVIGRENRLSWKPFSD